VTVSRPVEREVTDHEDFTGRTEPSASVEVRARVGGAIAEVHFRAGDAVRKGERLLDLDPKPFQAALDKAEADVRRCEARRKQAAAAYDKAQKAGGDQAPRAKELNKARDNLDREEQALLAARTALARARADLEFTRVTAPIGGMVGRLRVAEGDQVSANGTALATHAGTVLHRPADLRLGRVDRHHPDGRGRGLPAARRPVPGDHPPPRSP
jgi:multidrug efflux system membrane fusion protein